MPLISIPNHPVPSLPDDETTLSSLAPRLLCGTQEKKEIRSSYLFGAISTFSPLFFLFFSSIPPFFSFNSTSFLFLIAPRLWLSYSARYSHPPKLQLNGNTHTLCHTWSKAAPSFLPVLPAFLYRLFFSLWHQTDFNCLLFIPLSPLALVNGLRSIMGIINNNPLGSQCYRYRPWAQQQHLRSQLDPRLSSALYHARSVPPSSKHLITSPTRPTATIPQ